LPFNHLEQFLKEVSMNFEPIYRPPESPKWLRPKYIEESESQKKKLIKGLIGEKIKEKEIDSAEAPAAAMELYMVNKMTKTEKFNIVLRYNKLF
jgi:hypothetical protein